jgi:hypothetical protein
MALTKVTGQVVNTSTDLTVGVLTATTVSIGGTLTYEDVTNVDSVGLITARNGIQVTDKGVQVGTGATVDSAAANTLTFLTGGSERLRITSAGNIGIGTTSPGLPLDVVSNTSSETVRFRGASGGTGTLRFTSIDGATNYAFIQSRSTYFDLGTDTSIPLLFTTAGSERARIDSSGRLLIATTSSTANSNADDLQIGARTDSGERGITVASSAAGSIRFADDGNDTAGYIFYSHSDNSLRFGANGSERARIDSSGNVGINATSYTAKLHISGAYNQTGLKVLGGGAGYSSPLIVGAANGNEYIRVDDDGRLLVGTDTARSAGDVTAPLQVEGTGYQTSSLNLISNAGASSGNVPHISLAKSRGTSDGSSTVVASGDTLGTIQWCGADGTDLNSVAASIRADVDDTPGSNDMPGRIIFSTTADGAVAPTERMRIDSNGTIHMGDRASAGNAAHFSTATVNISKSDDLATSFSKAACFLHIGNASSTLNGVYPIGFGFSTNDRTHLPAYIQYITTDSAGAEHGPITFGTRNVTTDTAPSERMRIDSNGDVLIARTSASISNVGHYFLSGGATNHTRSGDTVMVINRLANDGNLIGFRQADSLEGSISVSGSSVSYNGGHLSRWSQLANGAARTEILRGSVLSNLDEMCEWGEENNEQLNRMKVSDVEGDPKVAGVFQAWDDDDDTYTNDFYCAMTGDFVIRIAQGTTVANGDLLMSAGDGTAKPQGDDIIRSKTIAKVTSTTVSTTYSDGSYCVPCVLMAC